MKQREIRFRAWDKVEHKIVFVTRLDFAYRENTEGNLIEGRYKNGGTSGPIADYILMQYTGLKDKNGKEIYEGDIIEYDATKYNRNCIDIVTSLEVAFDSDQLAYILHGIVEVIGNIYENPELISKEVENETKKSNKKM